MAQASVQDVTSLVKRIDRVLTSEKEFVVRSPSGKVSPSRIPNLTFARIDSRTIKVEKTQHQSHTARTSRPSDTDDRGAKATIASARTFGTAKPANPSSPSPGSSFSSTASRAARKLDSHALVNQKTTFLNSCKYEKPAPPSTPKTKLAAALVLGSFNGSNRSLQSNGSAKSDWSYTNFVGQREKYLTSTTNDAHLQQQNTMNDGAKPSIEGKKSNANALLKKSFAFAPPSRQRGEPIPNSVFPKRKPNLIKPNTTLSFTSQPLTAGLVLKQFRDALSLYESGEINKYGQIYYLGSQQSKSENRSGKAHSAQGNNFGFDDERGEYVHCIGEHIAYRYEVLSMLGTGSFGKVMKCKDHKTGGFVAIKIIRNHKRFHKQGQIEVRILKTLLECMGDGHCENTMVRMLESFTFRNHLCIAFEILSLNLYELTKLNSYQGFHENAIRAFATQLISALVVLHKRKVIHCDLKPENILLRSPPKPRDASTPKEFELIDGSEFDPAIKLIDFGSSCFESEICYTYIQSRFYRAPEVILGLNYGLPIDMWSFGCVLAELHLGYPLFPGKHEKEQLAMIAQALGPVPRDLLRTAKRVKLFFDETNDFEMFPVKSSKGVPHIIGGKPLKALLKNRPEKDSFSDLIERCLTWSSRDRITPLEAMSHPFIKRS